MFSENKTDSIVGFPAEDFGLTTSLKGLIVGNRVPKDYFVTKGKGESDITIHAGSYHLALKDAGIEMANIMTYSSILPGIANEIPRPAHITHGAVMETITATGNCRKGERVSAGIIWGWLHDRMTGQKYGGLVCEHYGDYSGEAIEKLLRRSLEELYVNGFEERFEFGEIKVVTETCAPVKEYGTALVALCFTDYYYPVLEYVRN